MVCSCRGKWLCGVWIQAPPNLPSNLQKIKIRATEPNLCFLCSPQCSWGAELSATNREKGWRSEERGRERNTEGEACGERMEKKVSEMGRGKMFGESRREICLRMWGRGDVTREGAVAEWWEKWARGWGETEHYKGSSAARWCHWAGNGVICAPCAFCCD